MWIVKTRRDAKLNLLDMQSKGNLLLENSLSKQCLSSFYIQYIRSRNLNRLCSYRKYSDGLFSVLIFLHLAIYFALAVPDMI